MATQPPQDDVQGYFDSTVGMDFSTRIDPNLIRQATQMQAREKYGLGATALGVAGFLVPDLIDTVASSIPFSPLERGDVNQTVLNAIGAPGLNRFYNERKGAVEFASGLGGMIATEVGIGKALKAAKPFLAGMKTNPVASRIMALDSSRDTALAAVRAVDRRIAQTSGGLNANAYLEPLRSLGFVNAPADMTRATLAGRARRAGASRAVARAGVSEAAYATLLNENEFWFADDLATNLAGAALGLGIAGTLGTIWTNYAMRRFNNSDAQQRIISSALDPTELERARLGDTSFTFSEQLRSPTAGGLLSRELMGHLGVKGGHIDEAVSYLVEAGAKPGAGVDMATAGSLANEKQARAFVNLNKVSAPGLPGVFGSGFSGAESGHWRALADYALRDPSGLIGTEHMAAVGKMGETIDSLTEKFSSAMKAREKEILGILNDVDSRRKLSRSELKAIAKELKQVQFNQTLTPVVLADGMIMTPGAGKVFDSWVEPTLRRVGGENQTRFWAEAPDGKKLGLEVDTDLSLYITKPGFSKKVPNAAALGRLDVNEMGSLFRIGRELVRDFQQTGSRMVVPKNPTWFQIDLAEELIRLTDDPTRVQWPAGVTREAAQVESFAQKADVLQGAEKKVVDGLDEDALHLWRFKLNLPRLSAYESELLGEAGNGLDILLRGTYTTGDEIRKLPLNGLLQTIEDGRKLNDLASLENFTARELKGNGFQFLTESTTGGAGVAPKPTSPVLLMKRPMNDTSWTKDNLAEQLAVRKATRINTMVASDASPMIRNLTTAALNSADLQQAAKSIGLSDLQTQASLPGMGNLSQAGSVRRITDGVINTEVRFRDTPTILAGQRLRNSLDQISLHSWKELSEHTFKDSLNRIASPTNQASNLTVQHWLSHAPGWDLDRKVRRRAIPGSQAPNAPAGTLREGTVWTMRDTAANRDRWKAQFGDSVPFPKDRTLVDNLGNPIYVDDLGMEVIQGLDKLARAKLANDNTLRRTLGLPEAQGKAWWIPPPDVEGKHIAYALDQRGQIIPSGAFIADSEEGLRAAIQRAQADPNHVMHRDGVVVRSLKDIKARASLLERVQMDMTNPGWMPVVGRNRGMGKNAKAYTDLGSLESTLDTYRNHFLRQGREVLYALTKESQDAARMRSTVMTPEKTASGKTIYDSYLEVMTGQSGISTEKSWWGEVQRPIASAYEAVVPKVINGATQLVRQPVSAASARAHDMVPEYLKESNFYRLTASEQEKWKEMRDGLGEAMPFKSVAEFLEAKQQVKIPPDMRKHMAHLQSWTATWILRMFEGTQALMNMAGTINAMPAITKSLRMLPNETVEDHARRVGHVASIFKTPDGANISTINMGKLMLTAFKRSWNRKSEPDYRRLAGKNMLSQSVSELNVAFNATSLGDKGAVNRFLNGDPSGTSEWSKRGLVGAISFVSDESEHLSRSWAHFMGDELGRLMGVPAGHTLDNFAHDFANKTIANYSPLNRAEAFQGPLGAPVALFQSFIVAYYQRLFRYLETQDWGALGTQYAWQAGIFGLQTIPGYQELNQFLVDRGTDELPYDKIVRDFGETTGDLMMSGVLGNLPKLFGAGEGIDLTSRGDVEFRLPVLAQKPAIVSTAEKVANGVSESIGMMMNEGFSGRRVAEILSNSLPNRPISGLIEVAALDGQDIDANGNIATTNKNWMDATARVLGTRTIRQASELNAFFTNKNQQEVQASKREALRKETRTAIRGGAKPEDLQRIFDRYVETGGDPRNYRRWLKSQFDDALTARGEKQLKETLRNPQMQAQAQRLLDAYVTLEEEEGYEANPLPAATWEDWQ